MMRDLRGACDLTERLQYDSFCIDRPVSGSTGEFRSEALERLS